MIKVALVADSHFDASVNGRLPECIRMHDFIRDDAGARGVDVFVHAGDFYERGSTPEDRLALASWVTSCAEVAPFFGVRGNHDKLRDLAILSRLKSRHPIVIEEAFGVHHIGDVGSKKQLAIAGMAWPRKSAILAADKEKRGKGATEATAREALRGVLRHCGLQLRKHDSPRLLLMHAMVAGSVTSTGQPLVGCDFEVDLTDLSLVGADAYLLGHIHKSQSWEFGGAPVIYPGSPRRTAYGEKEAKGYVMLSIDPTTREGLPFDQKLPRPTVEWEWIQAPAQEMLLLGLEWVDGEGFSGGLYGKPFGCDVIPAGADIRLRYHVSAAHREAASFAARQIKDSLLKDGAERVKVEAVTTSVARTRSDDWESKATTMDKLDELWRVRGTVPDANEMVRLKDKVTELEGKDAN